MKQWRKVAALGLAVVLPVCAAALTGCQKQGEKTLSVMVGNDKVENLTITKDVEALYPGDIDWVIASSTEQVSLMFASGDYPDVVFGNTLQDSDVSKYAANGVLVPLEDYITEEITPNICRLFDEYPSTRAISTFADGHIYALPRLSLIHI